MSSRATKTRRAPAATALVAADPAEDTVPVLMPQGIWRWLAWALSLVPVVGLTLGVLFSGSPERRARRFGRVCLALALLGLLVSAIHGWVTNAGLEPSGDSDVVVLD